MSDAISSEHTGGFFTSHSYQDGHITLLCILLVTGWQALLWLNRFLAPFNILVEKISQLGKRFNSKKQSNFSLIDILDDLEAAELDTKESQKIQRSVIILIKKIQNHQEEIFEILKTQASEKEVLKIDTIFQTTQMLAHDLKKPFSMFKQLSFIAGNKHIKNPEKILPSLITSFNKSIISAESLIDRIMQVKDNYNDLNCKPVHLQNFFQDIIFETEEWESGFSSNISLESFNEVLVDIDKDLISSAISNILLNAAQATNYKGNLWIIEKSRTADFIEITIGNSGSYIPEDNLSNIFNPFFTSGKPNGSGLGLAIVRKNFLAHHCQITVSSDQAKQTVEFHFTLPLCKPSVEETSISGINRELKTHEKPLKALLVDDQHICYEAIKAAIPKADSGASNLSLKYSKSYHQAIRAIESSDFDLFIVDYDLGKDTKSGRDFIVELKSRKISGFIALHSDSCRATLAEKLAGVSVDAILPKPVDTFTLTKIIQKITSTREATCME